jgi:hypothetical protein
VDAISDLVPGADGGDNPIGIGSPVELFGIAVGLGNEERTRSDRRASHTEALQGNRYRRGELLLFQHDKGRYHA